MRWVFYFNKNISTASPAVTATVPVLPAAVRY